MFILPDSSKSVSFVSVGVGLGVAALKYFKSDISVIISTAAMYTQLHAHTHTHVIVVKIGVALKCINST